MKPIKNLFLSVLIVFLFSCEATKESAASTNRETSGGRNTTNTERSVATRNPKADTRIEENSRNDQMFREIGMNQDQIKRYQDLWNRNQNLNRGRSNQGMTEFERIEQQDKIMKEILNETQFKKYQEWVLKQARK